MTTQVDMDTRQGTNCTRKDWNMGLRSMERREVLRRFTVCQNNNKTCPFGCSKVSGMAPNCEHHLERGECTH